MAVLRSALRAVTALTLAVVSARSTAADASQDLTPPSFERRFELLRKQGCSAAGSWLARTLKVRGTCTLLGRAPAGSSRDELVALLARRHSLPRAAAELLLEAELTTAWLLWEREGPAAEARVGQLYASAARAASGSLVPLAAFLERASTCTDALAPVLDATERPLALARRLLRRAETASGGRPDEVFRVVAPLSAFVLARGGPLPPGSAAFTDHRTQDELAVDLEVFERLRATGAPSVRLVPWAARLLRGAVDQGLPDLASHVLGVAPAAVKRAALALASRWLVESAGLHPSVRHGAGGGDPEDFYDARLDLAATLVEAAAPGEARRIAAQARRPREPGPSPGSTVLGMAGHPADRLRRAILAWHLDGKPPADPFDVAVDLRLSRESFHLAALAAPILAASHPEAVRFYLDHESEARPSAGMRALLPDAARRVEDLDAFAQARRAGALASLRPAEAPGDRPDRAAEIARRLLAESPASIWTEGSLPEGVAPCAPGAGAEPPADVSLPADFYLVHLDRKDSSLVALALSQRLDPTGEVSGGAYWLLVSHDGGGSWREIYTGLRQYRPYLATPRSAVPLIEGDQVRIEAVVREVDEAAIMFPPVCLPPKRESGPAVLTARLSDLERDADGDGLADLVERRILTDPEARDSDHDGIEDGLDPFPQFAGAAADADAGALQYLLDDWTRSPWSCTDDCPGLPPAAERLDRHAAGVVFIEGRRADFAGLRARQRVIVLEPGEYQEAVRRFGAFYPYQVELLLRSATGDRVYIEWDEHWRGGADLLRREDGRWIAYRISAWIT